MTDIEAMRRVNDEMERVKVLLDKAGIEWELSKTMNMLLFDGPYGECFAFPSQTYDGRICTRFTGKTWCDTAEDVLRVCGVTEDE